MQYVLLIDGSPYLSGDIYGPIFILLALLLLFFVLLYQTQRSFLVNEHLKYEFITIIAHKFRTPLSAIKWILDNLISVETDSHKLENLRNINMSNEKLIALTGTLIELTNQDKETKSLYKYEIINLGEFVKNVTAQSKDFFHEKNIFLSVRCESDDIFASIDRASMEYVLQTILENAYNYTPPGKNVDVIVGKKFRKAVVQVVDHGIGIDKADADKVFTKFYRAKNARRMDTEGVGVGLFLARSIVKRHHGKITFFSEGIDKGSAFMIELPRKNR